MAKLRSLGKVNFILPILLVLTLVFDTAVLYGNVAFSIVILLSKKRYSNFLEKGFVFKKICFKVKVMQTFKISSDYHIKACQSLKRRAILKIPGIVF